MNLPAIYERLWKIAQDGAEVHYQEWGSGGVRRGASGHFTSNIEQDPPLRPEIAIGRDSYRTRNAPDFDGLEPPAVLAELITLAHEYGHLRSFLDRRSVWNLYDNARFLADWIRRQFAGICGELLSYSSGDERDQLIRRVLYQGLNDETRERILGEEEYAWGTGRKVLATLDLEDFSQYDARTETSLDSYRFSLGMNDQWPDHIHDGVYVFVDGGQVHQGKLAIIGGIVEITQPSSNSRVLVPRGNIKGIRIGLS